MSASSGEWTVLRLINWTREYFARAGLQETRLSAEILLAKVLGCRRVELYTQSARLVEREHLQAYRELVRRAAEREPIAYLTGEKEFYSLTLRVSADVLIPRPETELLVDVALECARASRRPVRLWDACTGSGCVAVAAAYYAAEMTVLATDISEPALAVAGENVARYGLGDRVRVERADLLTLPPAAAGMSPFDVITANPPYVTDRDMPHLPEVVRREPDIALRAGPTGLEYLGRVVHDAPAHLREGGLLAMEFGLGRSDELYDLLNAAGRYADIRFLKDAAGIERTVVARRAADCAS
jgi:release factor glutamine methyltransferase